jgi:hypothetical protein
MTTEELTKQARFMRNASPSAFLGFCTAFAAYTRSQYEEMVLTSENLPNKQGHAQQCKKILDALEKAKDG